MNMVLNKKNPYADLENDSHYDEGLIQRMNEEAVDSEDPYFSKIKQ